MSARNIADHQSDACRLDEVRALLPVAAARSGALLRNPGALEYISTFRAVTGLSEMSTDAWEEVVGPRVIDQSSHETDPDLRSAIATLIIDIATKRSHHRRSIEDTVRKRLLSGISAGEATHAWRLLTPAPRLFLQSITSAIRILQKTQHRSEIRDDDKVSLNTSSSIAESTERSLENAPSVEEWCKVEPIKNECLESTNLRDTLWSVINAAGTALVSDSSRKRELHKWAEATMTWGLHIEGISESAYVLTKRDARRCGLTLVEAVVANSVRKQKDPCSGLTEAESIALDTLIDQIHNSRPAHVEVLICRSDDLSQ